jgi:hypothetical protein
MLRVRSFSEFYKIYEEEEPKLDSDARLFSIILSEMFAVYLKSASYVGDYPDVVKDIKKVQDADLDKKPQVLIDLIKLVAGKISDEVIKKELTGEEINKSLGELKSAYDELKVRTERDEKELQKIVSDICYDKLESLISIYKNPKNKIDESYSDERYSSFEPIFEVNTFKSKRGVILADVNTFISNIEPQVQNASTDRFKSKMKGILDQLGKIQKELADDPKWEAMKRRERIKRLAEIPVEISAISKASSEESSKELLSLGIEKKAEEQIKSAMDKIAEVFKKISDNVTKKIESAETQKGEESKGDEKKDVSQTKEILSGLSSKENLTKKGPNFKTIKSAQEALNKILPKSDQVVPDGLYGKKTEKAVETVSRILSILNPKIEITGKKMSPVLIETLKKLIDDKGIEEIRAQFTKK